MHRLAQVRFLLGAPFIFLRPFCALEALSRDAACAGRRMCGNRPLPMRRLCLSIQIKFLSYFFNLSLYLFFHIGLTLDYQNYSILLFLQMRI